MSASDEPILAAGAGESPSPRKLLSLSEATSGRLRLLGKKARSTWRIFRANRMGTVGLALLLAFFLMAVFAGQIMWILAHIAGWSSSYGPFDRVAAVGQGTAPSAQHWLGTDIWGYDILARTIYGSRVSLLVGLVATVVSMGLGTAVGLFSGYWGGWRDEVLMRVTDVFLVSS